MNYLKYLIIAFIVLTFSIAQSAYAQDASSSAKPVLATDSAKQTKIDNLKKEIASKAADLKAEVDKKIGNKVFTGKVSNISNNTLSLDAELGSRSIEVNEYTLYQDQSSQKTKKAFTLDTIKSGDTLIALGEVDEKQKMTAKKIIRINTIKLRSFEYVFGKISKVEPQKITLKNKNGTEQVVGFDSKIIIKNGKDIGAVGDIKMTRNAIAVYPKDEATRSGLLYILPAGGLRPTGDASSSSATPSARPR